MEHRCEAVDLVAHAADALALAAFPHGGADLCPQRVDLFRRGLVLLGPGAPGGDGVDVGDAVRDHRLSDRHVPGEQQSAGFLDQLTVTMPLVVDDHHERLLEILAQ